MLIDKINKIDATTLNNRKLSGKFFVFYVFIKIWYHTLPKAILNRRKTDDIRRATNISRHL